MMKILEIAVMLSSVLGLGYLLWRSYWVFAIVILMWPLEQLLQTYVPYLAYNEWVTNYLIAILAMVAVASRFMRGDPIFVGYVNRVWLLTIALYVLWLFGHLWSPAADIMVPKLGFNLRYQVFLLAVLPLLITDLRDFTRLATGIMVLGTAISVLILINPRTSYWGGRLILDFGMKGNLGERGNPLAVAEMGGLMALIAALIQFPQARAKTTILRVAAFVFGLGVAIGSGSRGQVLAAGIAGVLFYPMARRLANPRQFFAVLIGFLFLVAGVYIVFQLFVNIQNEERWTIANLFRDTLLRMHYVDLLFTRYLDEPAKWLLGLGTGAFAVVSEERGTYYVHNVAAEILCENGLIAFGIFLVICVFVVKDGLVMWRDNREDDQSRSSAALLMAICLYALLLALKQGTIAYPAPFFWWVIMCKVAYFERRLVAGSEMAIDEPIDELPARLAMR